MSHIEAAEYFEEEMNPNIYAGAAMIARIMTAQTYDKADIESEDVDSDPMPNSANT